MAASRAVATKAGPWRRGRAMVPRAHIVQLSSLGGVMKRETHISVNWRGSFASRFSMLVGWHWESLLHLERDETSINWLHHRKQCPLESVGINSHVPAIAKP